MTRIRHWRTLAILCGLVLTGCVTGLKNGEQEEGTKVKLASGTTTPEAREYSRDLDALRKAFNRDKDKVRLVTLLSPT